MLNLTLDSRWHSWMPAYERTVGVSTLCLSALAVYLMITKTPRSAMPFVKYLMLLQASLVIVDFNYCFIVCPIVLFPLNGLLCNGILCTLFGFSGHVGNTLMFFAVMFMSISVIFCFHYKYLSIGRMVDGQTISKTNRVTFRMILFCVFLIPGILQAGRYRNLETGPDYVKKDFPSLYYLFENREYRAIAYDQNLHPEYILAFALVTLFILLLSAVLGAFFVVTTFASLALQNTLSEKTRDLQYKTMVTLIIQTLTPLTIELIPYLLNLYSLAALSFDPNINNAFMCVQLTHTFFHTVILILTTPSYREACAFWRKTEKKVSTASVSPNQRRLSTYYSTI